MLNGSRQEKRVTKAARTSAARAPADAPITQANARDRGIGTGFPGSDQDWMHQVAILLLAGASALIGGGAALLLP